MTGTAEENGSILLSRRQTIRMVKRWIAAGTPAAAVRFGEGEGRLLAAERGDSESEWLALRKLARQTGVAFSAEEMLGVKAHVLRALDQADILGLRISARFTEEHRFWGERVARVYADRVAAGRKPAYLAHCLFNNDLYEALPQLLEGQRKIGLVTCRDLASTLRSGYGVADVAVYQVPSQYVVRDVDGDYEQALHGVPIWPDFYRDLRGRIVVRDPGEVFLVGAGLFGKDLCIRIKELGGIALDMGSTLDAMAQKVTRGPDKPAFRPLPQAPKGEKDMVHKGMRQP